MDVKDIPGAIACSKKRGLTTNRHTNPLWPEYTFPGHSELKDKFNNPYGKTLYKDKKKEAKEPKENNELINKVSKTTNNFYPMYILFFFKFLTNI